MKGDTMKYKAIIFDMDGTITNTEKIWEEATIRLLQRRGIAYEGELKQRLSYRIAGLATHRACGVIKEIAGLSDHLDDLINEKLLLAHELYEKGVEFIPGFSDFHKKIIKKQMKSAIATNATAKTVQITNNSLNLKQFFGEHMYDVGCVNGVCKPDPAIYTYAAGKLGVDPEECIAIEDSAHGIASASDAGMFCIGIRTSPDRTQVAKAHHIINGYDELDLDQLMGLVVK